MSETQEMPVAAQDAAPLRQTSLPLEGDDLKVAILRQVEYYLSPENLARDAFLLSNMNEDYFAEIGLIAGFAKLKALSTDIDLIVECIGMSEKLELDETRKLVRPLILPGETKRKSSVILRDVDSDIPEEEIRALFDEAIFGPIDQIRADIGDTWFIGFADEINTEEQLAAVEKLRETELRGKRIRARVKTDNIQVNGQNFTPSSPTSPATSPTAAQAAAMAAQAQYAAFPYQAYGFYGAAPMYYAAPAGSGAPGQGGAWIYGGWDPSTGMPAGPYPGGRRRQGPAGGSGRGRAAGRGAAGGRNSGRGRSKGAGGPQGGASQTGGGAGGKKGKKSASAAKQPKKQPVKNLELSSASMFPSLPMTPTRAGRDSAAESADGSAEGEPGAGKQAQVFSGWAAVARKGPQPAASSDEQLATAAPPVGAALDSSLEADGSSSVPSAEPVPAPAPAPAPAPIPLPEPEQAPTSEPESSPQSVSGGTKSWAQMAKSKASAPVRPLAAGSKAAVSGQQVLNGAPAGAAQRLADDNTGNSAPSATAWGNKDSDSSVQAPESSSSVWNDGEERTPRSVEAAAPATTVAAPEVTGPPKAKSWADMAKARGDTKS